ncbi:MAG: YraN family protein [Porticoccaceae bacterium]|nr:YraN family protein [Porticoccaceae bacterium]
MKFSWLKKASPETVGKSAENYVARHLKREGLTIVASNYRSRRGEIDLIARAGDSLVFIEVRLRNHRQFASGMESVDRRKQERLIATANAYLQENYGNNPPPCRFDVVSLATNRDNGGQYDLEWLRDAFRPEF